MKRSRVGTRKAFSVPQGGKARRRDGARARKPAVIQPGTCESALRLETAQRERAEEKLRETEERYQTLVDLSPDAVAVHRKGKYIFMNRACLELFGISRLEELADRSVLDLVHPDDRELVADRIRETLERPGERTALRDVRLLRVNGKAVWVESTGKAICFGGEPALLVVFREAAERKAAEAELRDKEEQFRAMFAVSSVGKAQAEAATGRFLRVNAAFCRITGYSEEELLARTIKDISHPEDWERDWPNYSQMANGGTAGYDTEKRYIRRDGQVVWARVNANLIRDAAGRPVRTTAVIEDITERKRAEQALRESEARLAQAVRVARLGTFDHDHVADVIEASAEMRAIFGFARNVRVTLPMVLERVAPEDREKVATSIRRAHDPGGDGMYEMEHRILDGRCGIRWVSVRSQSFFEGKGNRRRLVRTIGAVLDVTDQKETEVKLERAVRERTAKLQELVGELEHFSYSITHDMRAPLRGMQGFAELMAEACAECGKQDPHGFLQRIIVSAGRMDALITDALNYSKAVRQELALEPVAPGALLRGMLDSYPELQPAKANIEIRGEIPLVMGNQAGLTQCFSNLLGNAVKFVKPGQKPQIKIWADIVQSPMRTVQGEAGDGEWVRIWVEDQGIGIPASMLPRVFEMFSRGHSTYQGTGIGLALVRKVTERMGGRVGVESEDGQGSRFWLELKSAERTGQP